MKILWLSNKAQSGRNCGGTGTWLTAIAEGLVESGEIELANVTSGNVRGVLRQDFGDISQWIISSSPRYRHDGLPPGKTIEEIINIIKEFSPDLVHVWGTEDFWGLLSAKRLVCLPTLLDMQGYKRAIARVYHGGLTFQEQLACIGPKEILRRTTIFQVREHYRKWGTVEKEIISGNRFITTQSTWLEAQVRAINNECRIFHNEFALQKAFYAAPPWRSTGNPIIFCSTSYPAPFKGLHVAIRAVAILKKRFPNIKLHIAGAHQKKGLRQDGFVAWLNREAKRLDVESNLCWLGPLTVEEIVCELHKCSVFLLPTFIEGYSLALAEAMMLGVPTVVSFTGGTSFLALDQESALFFPPGDEAMCAHQLEHLFIDQSLAERISRRAREIALERNDHDKVVQHQIEIYRNVLAQSGNSV